MIFPFYSEYPVDQIRTGIQSCIFSIDENDRWRKGTFIELWYKMPKEAGSYEFAKSRVGDIKDMIWYPDSECKERKLQKYNMDAAAGIMTIIHADGTWNHLKTEDEQYRFIKHCGYSSMAHFKEKKTKLFQTKILCLAPKWGEGRLILPDISRFKK